MTKPRLSIFILIGFLLGLAAPAWAGYQEGIDAYERGDYDTALKELRPLAEQGEEEAQYFLGIMYDQGQGVPQNDQEAVRWYRLAAEKRDASAQFNLGFKYVKGYGVPKDYVLAHMWMNLAAAQGSENAVEFRDLLEKRMTPAQLAEAQRLAREWKPKGE